MKTKFLHLFTGLAYLFTPVVIFGQAPTLGTTANFVLFSTNGALTNTGLSHLTGHVGTNNGGSTNFGNVNGQMHNQDGISATCAADLLIAYNQLNATIPTFFPAPLLGGGQSLNAGVYAISGNSTLNGTLTLNAQGNANAVFVIQIAGAFASGAGATVILANNAKACNVYWKIEGAVNLASGTIMKGTIVVNNAAITMNSGSKLEGRALTTAGSISIDKILAYTPIGCGSPNLMGPASPTLASAACYAIFSGNGSVSNSGVTAAVGDVGTNVGLTTGFNPLNITGTVHPIPDGNTAACDADLLIAYNYLNTLPFDIELLFPAQFGFNLVLTPHVYRMNAATAFTDTLFLDGGGNANAVFVIQINGALNTSTFAKVSLINGTLAQNVYWKVDGSVSINNFSEFEGTIICNNGAVSLNTGVFVNGRVLTTNGAFSTAAVTVNIPTGCNTLAPPFITGEPSSKTVCEGDIADFNVAAVGASLTYQWRKGTVNLINGGNISGATSATLTVNPANLIDAAAYNVIVTGAVAPKDTSINVILGIMTIPSISVQPVDLVNCLGSTAIFSISASGANLTYQWKKGTTVLVDGGSISGATTTVLSINPVAAADLGGGYHVEVAGTCTPTAKSLNAVLIECNLTGIKDLNGENSEDLISIYPNPFTNVIHIRVVDISKMSNSTLKIYNLIGTEIMSLPINKSEIEVQTNELASGLYFYKLIDGDTTLQAGKLISH